MSPRPILKREPDLTAPALAPLPFSACSSAAMFASSHVHFPPSPALASTHLTHSTTAYNRAPISVQHNICALPERGCPGRTYAPDNAACSKARKASSGATKGNNYSMPPNMANMAHDSYFPPYNNHATQRCPELVPDLGSSESDDSDGLIFSPPDGSSLIFSASFAPPMSSNGKSKAHFAPSRDIPLARAGSQEDMRKALTFLPHPPSPDRDRQHRSSKRRSSTPMKRKPPTHAESSPVDACFGGF